MKELERNKEQGDRLESGIDVKGQLLTQCIECIAEDIKENSTLRIQSHLGSIKNYMMKEPNSLKNTRNRIRLSIL